MNFKKIFFTILCSSSLMSAVEDRSTNSKELIYIEIIEKLQELASIGNKVTQQEELIANIRKKIEILSCEYINKRKNELKGLNNPAEEENNILQITSELVNECNTFKAEYIKNANENTKEESILYRDFMKNQREEQNNIKGLIKFYSIRELYEEVILNTLIATWEHYANQLNNLNIQISVK